MGPEDDDNMSDDWDEEYTIEEFTLLLPDTKQRKKEKQVDKRLVPADNPEPPRVFTSLCCILRKGAISQCLKDDDCVIL